MYCIGAYEDENYNKRVARADFGMPTNIKCEGHL